MTDGGFKFACSPDGFKHAFEYIRKQYFQPVHQKKIEYRCRDDNQGRYEKFVFDGMKHLHDGKARIDQHRKHDQALGRGDETEDDVRGCDLQHEVSVRSIVVGVLSKEGKHGRSEQVPKNGDHQFRHDESMHGNRQAVRQISFVGKHALIKSSDRSVKPYHKGCNISERDCDGHNDLSHDVIVSRALTEQVDQICRDDDEVNGDKNSRRRLQFVF